MSDLIPAPAVVTCASEPGGAAAIETFPARSTDLEGLAIRRLLPARGRRMLGAWCFLDHFGPVAFAAGQPMDVAPHPHIGLQTVSWLLEGEIRHDDSLGLTAVAVPGALNLMTAGRGIAHAERTPGTHTGRLHGVQLWIALPDAAREVAPAFEHHARLPELPVGDGRAHVFVGELGGLCSPARVFSPLVGAELAGENGARLRVPLRSDWEYGLVLLAGALELGGRPLAPEALHVLGGGRDELCLVARAPATRALLLGGEPFGEPVLMWWNFVARTHDELVAARDDWQAGRRFGEVAAYGGARLAAPPLAARVLPGR